jgi:hypothetical protein
VSQYKKGGGEVESAQEDYRAEQAVDLAPSRRRVHRGEAHECWTVDGQGVRGGRLRDERVMRWLLCGLELRQLAHTPETSYRRLFGCPQLTQRTLTAARF